MPCACIWMGNTFPFFPLITQRRTKCFQPERTASNTQAPISSCTPTSAWVVIWDRNWNKANFFYFAKKNLSPVPYQILSRLTKLQHAVVLPRSRTNFCQAWNLTDLSIHAPWLKENVNQENFIYPFSQSILIRSPPKLFLSCAAINGEDGRFVPWNAA